jgi:hypothetical protein
MLTYAQRALRESVLVDVGAHAFNRSPKHLIDLYAQHLLFDRVVLWDVLEIPVKQALLC